MRKIVVSHECPPIPIRTMDWCAYFEGDEEGGSRGWGRTAREAIADLIDNCAEDYDERLGEQVPAVCGTPA